MVTVGIVCVMQIILFKVSEQVLSHQPSGVSLNLKENIHKYKEEDKPSLLCVLCYSRIQFQSSKFKIFNVAGVGKSLFLNPVPTKSSHWTQTYLQMLLYDNRPTLIVQREKETISVNIWC